IYPPERAQKALQNFFRIGNLAALREMALRRTMEEVDDQLQEYMQEHDLSGWTVDERFVVAIDYRPISATLLRRAWHMASRFKCQWTAVHIRCEELNERQQAGLAQHKQMAADLGAKVEEIMANDV